MAKYYDVVLNGERQRHLATDRFAANRMADIDYLVGMVDRAAKNDFSCGTKYRHHSQGQLANIKRSLLYEYKTLMDNAESEINEELGVTPVGCKDKNLLLLVQR